MIKAFEAFAHHILSGKEGILFSMKNDVVGHKIYFGVGDRVKADFNKGPFPFFSVVDWQGEKSSFWHFDQFYTDEDDFDSYADLESLKATLNIKNLESYASETQASFKSKVEVLKSLEQDGEFWVANFTQDITGDLPKAIKPEQVALKCFHNFLKLGKNHCGGVVLTKEQIFCSLSPETFLVQNENVIKTFPIKGTGSQKFLENSEKEISELAMITDLLRNDLGEICTQVELKRERYLTEEQNFYHARAEVEGKLSESEIVWDKYKALLPAGSISGAPKKRVLETLSILESFNRDFYTGTFGLKLKPEKSIFNILIRTLFIDQKNCSFSFPVGAGITIDSNAQLEWEETFRKAQILLDCLKP